MDNDPDERTLQSIDGHTGTDPESRVNVLDLVSRFREHDAKVGVIGLGYVGLPLACTIAEKGFATIGFDIDEAKIRRLNSGASYIRHIGDERIAALCASGRLDASSDFSRLRDVDAIIICVPTPLSPQREPDLGFVERTCASVSKYLRRGQLVVLESSTYPGTTREVMQPILERSGLRSGQDFFLAYSPEREDPGNRQFTTQQIPKVVGADGPDALRLATTFYAEVVTGTVPVSSLEAAEAVKLTENIFRAVNIALVNELKIVFDAMGVDIWEVIEAAKTKPFGYMPFYPGPGLGGHCIPIDPFYLTWKAREFGIATKFIELAGEINTAMPQFIVSKVATVLNERDRRALNGAHILLIGIAYKKNVDDVRESPAFRIMTLLEKQGARVSFHDPISSEIPATRDHPELAGRRSIPLEPQSLTGFDAAVVCTDHDAIDYAKILEHCPVVIDTRNVYGRLGLASSRVVKA